MATPIIHVVFFQFKSELAAEERREDGLTHAFVVEFQSQEDRDYYVRQDPAHNAFVENVLQKLVQARIMDFSPGVL
ncbi:Uncharacterized protein TCAP_02718 [Tolypocladium capitatum]|uniref:Stress-response A/B barrel domain-containing protein n=1 Tax=Tolypocladium capitatum TaxID=45235 RepID=A0A2K3QII2_9HYPO|nr:Uncharacterized protein TCAP_02718 [Tolypocladium capitatum]